MVGVLVGELVMQRFEADRCTMLLNGGNDLIHAASHCFFIAVFGNGQALVVFVSLVDGGEAGRDFADEGNVGTLLHRGCLDV